jgi:hypothetical protein
VGAGPAVRGGLKDQLGQQQITFKAADKLTAEEKQSACLVKYAGQQLTTGKQAGQAAVVAYGAAGLLLLLGVAGLIHAAATPSSKGFAVPERAARETADA